MACSHRLNESMSSLGRLSCSLKSEKPRTKSQKSLIDYTSHSLDKIVFFQAKKVSKN